MDATSIPTCCGGQGCPACEDQPVLADVAAVRRYWCMVDGCSYEPRHMHGDNALCCGHYGEYSGVWCDCAGQPIVADPDLEF